MKTLRLALGVVFFPAAWLDAQDAVPTPSPAAPTAVAPEIVAPATASGQLTAEQLEQLLGPIALYPDALIALILPACTQPADIVLAARHVRQNGADRSQIEIRAWDESVKALTNYPEVLKWLDDNLNWTKQLGEAFAEQPAEVMKAVQRLRAKARASGALVDTPQQQILVDASVIRIVPAQPDVIYVPYYDPTIVYVNQPVTYVSRHPIVTFGIGCRVGSWLCNDFNWTHCTLWIGDRHRRWDHGHDWRRPVVAVTVVNRPIYAGGRSPRQWTPPPRAARPTVINTAPVHAVAGSANNAPQRSITRPTYRSTPTVDVASAPAPTPVNRPEMFQNIRGSGAVSGPQPVATTAMPATAAPQVTTSAPSFRTRTGGDGTRSGDLPRNRSQQPALATPPPAVATPSAPVQTVAPLHIAGGRSAQSYTNVAPAPQVRASAPAAQASPPVNFSRIAAPPAQVQPAPAPAPAATQSSPPPAAPASRGGGGTQQDPERPGRERRNVD